MDLETKWCHRCQESKPITDFGVNKGRKDGLTVYCVVCGREASRQSRMKLRRQALDKLGGACILCGFSDDRALQFDHVNSDGSHDRAHGLGSSSSKLLRAIIDGTTGGRIQLLCANCNQIKMWEADERRGRRFYTREIPEERIDRPNRRWTDEQRKRQSEKARELWDDPERRKAMVAAQTAAGQDAELRAVRSRAASENMRRRWASGEVPNRRSKT